MNQASSKHARVALSRLNTFDERAFVEFCGPLFEHSPWIASRAWTRRPFGSIDDLHQALVRTVESASDDEKLSLISAHPDLVGRLAREGLLTQESTHEQSAAGLTSLTPAEAQRFDHYNAAYRAAFGFPFVICARENKKDTILAAFPVRLKHTREQEISCALAEIYKIARLRLLDRVRPD